MLTEVRAVAVVVLVPQGVVVHPPLLCSRHQTEAGLGVHQALALRCRHAGNVRGGCAGSPCSGVVMRLLVRWMRVSLLLLLQTAGVLQLLSVTVVQYGLHVLFSEGTRWPGRSAVTMRQRRYPLVRVAEGMSTAR